MKGAELIAFADLLTRHLASVIAAERGYVEKPCPSCSGPACRGLGIAESMDGIERGPFLERVSISSRVASGACQTCHGGQRVWSRPKTRFRPLSDRELINRAARESVQTGRLAGGERPSG